MKLDQITLHYGGRKIFSDFSLEIEQGKITCLMGESGIGKTSLLRLTAGLIKPSKGMILTPNKKVSYVFQEPRLIPWYTVLENVLWVLNPDEKKAQRYIALKLLEEVGLRDSASLYPAQLSGGMKQRVSVARAFLHNPELLLMDEPFQGLDADTRADMHQLLLQLWTQTKPTILLVTHDMDEALALSHTVWRLTGSPVSKCERIHSEC